MTVTTYFHRTQIGADLSTLRAEHQRQFPGNSLAVFDLKDGTQFVKVAYPAGTSLPMGATRPEDAKALIEQVDKQSLMNESR